jgi:hypothetical protein
MELCVVLDAVACAVHAAKVAVHCAVFCTAVFCARIATTIIGLVDMSVCYLPG